MAFQPEAAYHYQSWREDDDGAGEEDDAVEFLPLPHSCPHGHRSSLNLQTTQGGTICLVCFSNLLSSPASLSIHVSFAVSQLSEAIRSPSFLQTLHRFHARLLVSPLVHALASSDDEALARQIIDLLCDLCDSSSTGGADDSLSGEFVARASDCISSGSLAWSQRLIYMLHCLGVLLDRHADNNPSAHINDRVALISSLMNGLRLPSDEIRGEVLFVLYKLSILQEEEDDDFSCFCPKLVNLSLEALIKTENDDVRINCLALLTVLARKGHLEHSFSSQHRSGNPWEADDLMENSEVVGNVPLVTLFADAIKGPLLSSDHQVQMCALDLIFHSLSADTVPIKQTHVFFEENISDYIFEVLRLSGNKEPLIISCIRVLGLLATAEQAFRKSLVIGFPTLILVLKYVAEIPLHPTQADLVKLILSCLTDCPGVVSTIQIEELALILSGMFRRDANGEIGMLPETFTNACTTFVALLKLPSSLVVPKLTASVQEVSKNAVLPSLSAPQSHPSQVVLYSLYLLKESYAYCYADNSNINSETMKLSTSIIHICETNLLPWLKREQYDMEDEENILGVFETFHSILIQGSEIQTAKFAKTLASSSWFSLSFGYLGLFPSNKMKLRVYLLLSSIIDSILGHGRGQPIRDASLHLPPDPLDLLYLLGQKSTDGSDLVLCQTAVLTILYASSLHDERLADEKQVLASLEQCILVNCTGFLCEIADSTTLSELIHLYSLLRGAHVKNQKSYSQEAEKLLFLLMVEREWDLLPELIHPAALRWLFQQDKINKTLSNNVLSFCRLISISKARSSHGNQQPRAISTQQIAELVASGDNFAASIIVSLLRQVSESGNKEDTISVVSLIIKMINIHPAASDQFCLHGIGDTIRSMYFSKYSIGLFTTCSLMIFNILHSANSTKLLQHDAWLSITIQLLNLLTPELAADTCHQEEYLLMSILSLILHHSTKQSLKEASSAILLSNALIAAVKNIIQTACAKGSALADHNEETSCGETIIYVLLIYFFSLKSCHALLQGTLDWQDFFQSSSGIQPLSVIRICCDDLCKLIYFGSAEIKWVASQCLLELLTRISDQRSVKHEELKCPVRYLQSVVAVLEGFIFHGDTRVATNCGLCLSIIFGWVKLGSPEQIAVQEDKWCRLVVDELAMSIAAPSFVSKSFTDQSKAAYHVARALLKLNQVLKWVQYVFDASCISKIIGNLSTSSVTVETVQLFRELAAQNYLNDKQIAGLNHVFQACREHAYMESNQEQCIQEHFDQVVFIPDDLRKLPRMLMHLMSSTCGNCDIQIEKKRLLEEIEKFFLQSRERELQE
ncbi:protein PUTATIVE RECOMBINATION INITIATION DEFECT 1 [Aristolochia californica]|uniref:protein PUTATIVE RECOMBINATION INITIATION DEFECT 1 n=1 Tax=Aristolochia californica TaxID=171875 RepID=UPI0035E0FAFD